MAEFWHPTGAAINNNEETTDLMGNRNEESVGTLAFEPERLRLARELREWSQADLAVRLGVTPAAVSQFETGVTRPGTDALDRMTSALGVPVQFFSLPLTETHDGWFRSLRRTSVTHRRRARALAYIAHDLAVAARAPGLPPVRPPQIPVTGLVAPDGELEEAARQARQAFGMPSGPVPNVAQTLEKHGILVIRLPLDTADVDAFSLPFHDRPIVVLGTDKNDRARSRFDGAHELGHLVVHGDQIWGHQSSRAPGPHLRRRLPHARRRHPRRTTRPRRLACPVPAETKMAGITGGPPDAGPDPRPHEPEQLPDRSQGSLSPRMATHGAGTARTTRPTHLPETSPGNTSRTPGTRIAPPQRRRRARCRHGNPASLHLGPVPGIRGRSRPPGFLPYRSRPTAFAEQPHSSEIPWWPRWPNWEPTWQPTKTLVRPHPATLSP